MRPYHGPATGQAPWRAALLLPSLLALVLTGVHGAATAANATSSNGTTVVTLLSARQCTWNAARRSCDLSGGAQAAKCKTHRHRRRSSSSSSSSRSSRSSL